MRSRLILTGVGAFLAAFLAPGGSVGVAQAEGGGVRQAVSTDAEAERLAGVLEGSWRAPERGVSVHIARIPREEGRIRLYAEIAPVSKPQDPSHQEVLEIFRYEGALRLRVLEFRSPGGRMPTLYGMWTVPERLPEIGDERLFVSMDLVVSEGDGAWRAATAHPVPVMGDAVERSVVLEISDSEIVSIETPGAGGEGAERARWERYDAGVEVIELEGGVVAIEYAGGEGERAERGDTLSVLYTGYNESGQVFDSNRVEGRAPFDLTLPGRVIRGWQVGLDGAREGAVRRLVIPAEMGYGARSPHPLIPSNETLVFDVEVLSVTPGG